MVVILNAGLLHSHSGEYKLTESRRVVATQRFIPIRLTQLRCITESRAHPSRISGHLILHSAHRFQHFKPGPLAQYTPAFDAFRSEFAITVSAGSVVVSSQLIFHHLASADAISTTSSSSDDMRRNSFCVSAVYEENASEDARQISE